MNKKALIEALIFVSDKPLSIKRICYITGLREDEVKDLIEDIKKDFEKEERGFMLVETPSGFEFIVKPEYREFAAKVSPFSDLSPGMLRTLAIVVANGPVKQSTIVKYQGNKAYSYIRALEKKGLVKTEEFGRTKIVSVSSDFEKYFGMNPEEIREMIKKKLESS